MNETYKVAELRAYTEFPKISERKHRQIDKNEVLVKVHCAPIHPGDLLLINGTYGNVQPDEFPLVIGMEGSGEIVITGEEIDPTLVGKRVAIYVKPNRKGSFVGTWSEFLYTDLSKLIIFEDKSIPFDRICFLLNPLTAIGMAETIKQTKTKSTVITGALTPVGKMFIRLCNREGIETICLLTGEEEIQRAEKEVESKHLIDMNKISWRDQLKEGNKKFNNKICFDIVGEHTGRILLNMPEETLLFYGSLVKKELSHIHIDDFVFNNKSIKGWWVSKWLAKISCEKLHETLSLIKSEYGKGSKLFKNDIGAYYPLQSVEAAIEDFLHSNSKGKVIIKPAEKMERL